MKIPGMKIDETQPHLGGNIEGGDIATFCPDLWSWLVSTCDIKTVLDVGCGEGHSMIGLAACGCQVVGIDGLKDNVEKCKLPALHHDLTQGPAVFHGIDMTWCCEVVEHIEEQHIENLLSTICVGRILAMTYAAPDQPGHHHVNCQSAEYWIKRITARGYVYDPKRTEEGKALCPPSGNHFGWHGLLFWRGS